MEKNLAKDAYKSQLDDTGNYCITDANENIELICHKKVHVRTNVNKWIWYNLNVIGLFHVHMHRLRVAKK